MCALLTACLAVALMIPTQAFAYVISSQTGVGNSRQIGEATFAGYSRAEYTSDLYLNGYTSTIWTLGPGSYVAPGNIKNRTCLYQYIGGNYLIGDQTIANTYNVSRYSEFVTQVWAKTATAGGRMTVGSTHTCYGSPVWAAFNTNVNLDVAPGPTPRSIADSTQDPNSEAQIAITYNESGLSFGEARDIEDPTKADGQPDLVAAVAKNGELGYIYFNDLQKANTGEGIASAEENYARFSSYENELAQQFNEEVSNCSNGIALSDQAISESFELLTTSENGISLATEFLNNEIASSANPRTILDNKDVKTCITDDDYRMFYSAAQEKLGTKIPVYKEDGVTIIGEFVVNSY